MLLCTTYPEKINCKSNMNPKEDLCSMSKNNIDWEKRISEKLNKEKGNVNH